MDDRLICNRCGEVGKVVETKHGGRHRVACRGTGDYRALCKPGWCCMTQDYKTVAEAIAAWGRMWEPEENIE